MKPVMKNRDYPNTTTAALFWGGMLVVVSVVGKAEQLGGEGGFASLLHNVNQSQDSRHQSCDLPPVRTM